ncbi:MAG: plasmid mobilization protein [Phycisphaerales bacterium]
MGRPRKNDNERRTASVRADLTEAEKAFVQAQAAKVGLSEAEYTRRRVLGYAVVSPATARQTDPALLSDLNRIGVNVNQLARAVHTGREFVVYWQHIGRELEALLARLTKGA